MDAPPQDLRRPPVFNAPAVVVALVALLALIHGGRELLGDETELDLVRRLAFVPGRVAALVDPAGVAARLADLAGQGQDGARTVMVGRYFLGDGSIYPWTALTYAFLHGSLAHLGLNGVWLLAFGSAVARRFGAARFLALAAVSAIAGAAAHLATHFYDLAPVVGASAAVSGAMGAATRFVFQPGAPLGGALLGTRSYDAPAPGLVAALSDRRAAMFLLTWLALNVLSGAGAESLGISDMPIAWEAHIGGLAAGLFLFPLFDPRR